VRPADERDLELLAERWRLGVQDPVLVGWRIELDRCRVPGATLASTLESQLAADGRSLVVEVDLDRDPGAEADVALEQHAGAHRGCVTGPRGRARERQEERSDHEERGERATSHDHSRCGGRVDLTNDAPTVRKVAPD